MSGSIVRVGTAVLIRDAGGRILFGLRKSAHGRGTWGLPGGAVDFGETPLDSARREVSEETGLELGELRIHVRVPYTNTAFTNGSQWITLYFEADHVGGDPRVMEPEKCERWEWFGPDDPPDPVFEPLTHGLLWKTK